MADEFATYPAAIKPATKVVLAKVPMSGNNKDIILKSSAGAYKSWVQSKKIAEESDFSYQRQDSVIRYPGNADDIIASGANYVMWTNTNFNNKTFYAYITSVEYKNPNVSWIHIDIDAFSTFIYDTKIGYQFVERALPEKDGVGDNRVEESFGNIDYFEHEADLMTFQDMSSIIYVSGFIGGDFGLIDGIPNPNELSVCNTVSQLKSKLIGLGVDPLHSSIGATAIPKEFVEGYPADHVIEARAPEFEVSVLPYVQNIPSEGIAFDGTTYHPNNWKLFTYPFTALKITNNMGASQIYKYEYFDGTPSFVIRSNLIAPINITATPIYYNGTYKDSNMGILVGTMPMLPVRDADFSSVISLMLGSMVGGVAGSVSTSATKSAASSFASEFAASTAVGGMSAEDYISGYNKAFDAYKTTEMGKEMSRVENASKELKHRSDVAKRILAIGDIMSQTLSTGSPGMSGTLGTLISRGAFGVFSKKLQIRPWAAKVIDDFFSMFGYKMCSMMDLNIFKNQRAVFNYYKTIECNIPTSCPTEYRLKIQDIFDSGVRLWHDESKFCDYSEATLKANSLH